MKLISKFLAVGVVATMATTAFAADHRDGANVQTATEINADINDVFVFPDGNNLVFAMTVNPFADTNSKFSDTVKYVFHTSSHTAFGGPATGTQDIICTFTTAQVASCWVGTSDYVTGDASPEAGLPSADGKLRVFAGLRADPFYFYLDGFNAARSAVLGAIPGLVTGNLIYPSGCPKLDQGTVTQLQTALVATTQDMNKFKAANGLGIVVAVDKSLVTTAADEAVSVWAGTYN